MKPTITVLDGDIFSSRCNILVNAVNCIGKMGTLSGLFKQRFPTYALDYQECCERGDMVMGRFATWTNPSELAGYEEPRFIISLPTMQYPGTAASLPHIIKSLRTLSVSDFRDCGVHSIAFPALGCGVGGLNFNHIVYVILSQMERSRFKMIEIYRPHEAPDYSGV